MIEDLKEAEIDELKQLRWERKRDIMEYDARKKHWRIFIF
jgi:hypothetical protein